VKARLSFFLLASLRLTIVLYFLGILSANLSVAEQQGKRALSNADVVGMVKGGLSESTILVVIEHSICEFDTSPAAIIELKKQGVSSAVMEAMDARPRLLACCAASAEHRSSTSGR
jgi:hypothetical protein